MSEGLLHGRHVVVTGAGKGIGRATAEAAAQAGASVSLIGTSVHSLEEVGAVIAEMGGDTDVHQVDVSDSARVASCFDSIRKTRGAVYGAFNNAGIDGPLALTTEYPEEEFNRVMDVNVKGVWNCMKQELLLMAAAGAGSIVNCASALASAGQYNMSAYCASKAAVLGLTRVAALEYGPQGVRVNSVSPGVIETPMMRTQMDNTDGLEDLLLQSEPIGRLGRPEEIASIVLWLWSDGASFAHGSDFNVDGGYLVR